MRPALDTKFGRHVAHDVSNRGPWHVDKLDCAVRVDWEALSVKRDGDAKHAVVGGGGWLARFAHEARSPGAARHPHPFIFDQRSFHFVLVSGGGSLAVDGCLVAGSALASDDQFPPLLAFCTHRGLRHGFGGGLGSSTQRWPEQPRVEVI